MGKNVHAVDTLYHLNKENHYVRIALIVLDKNEYEVSIQHARTVDFHWNSMDDVYVLSDLHEAMNVYRDCYVSFLQEGYCYWGLIPSKQAEWERTAEKNRLLNLAQNYCNAEALRVLQEWRDEQAEVEGVQSNQILSNRHLRSLATFLPQNEEELKNCPGIGETKQRRYGKAILHICSPYKRQFNAPLPSILPKYKYKDGEEERFLPYRGERIPAPNASYLREKVLQIGETGYNVDELTSLAKVDDRETRKRVASAANKLCIPELTKSLSTLLFDEGPQVRQYMLRAIISSDLQKEMADDVRRLLDIEPKSYNRLLCKRILRQINV